MILEENNTFEYIDFVLTPTVESQEGRWMWNAESGTMQLGMPGGNVVGQQFEEIFLPSRPKNVYGTQIDNGEAVRISGATGNVPEVELVNNSEVTAYNTIAIATEDVADQQRGFYTTFGAVRELDTSYGSAGDEVFLDDIDGVLTAVKPVFPEFCIRMGNLIRSHATEGSLFANIRADRGEDLANFWNGTIREFFNALPTSDGATITLSVERSGGGNLTMQFSDGMTILDCTPACTIELTAGSDNAPQENWIYIPKSTKVLTKSTSGYPSEEHIEIGFFFCSSAAKVAGDSGPLINQNINNEIADTSIQGHLSHMGDLARLGPGYNSGLDPNGTDQALAGSYFNEVVSGTSAYFKSSSGIMYQMHKHAIPAIDTQSSVDIHAVNWNGDLYHEFSNLYDIVADANGASLSNKYFNVFFFATGNKSGEYSPLMCQLPTGSYVSSSSVRNDSSGYDVTAMPRQFNLDSSVGVPICRMTLKWSGGLSTLTHIETADLRAGGRRVGSGTVGSLVNFADNQITIFDETDISKILTFDVGTLVSSGNTRTLQIPDANGIIALASASDGTVSHSDTTGKTSDDHHAQVHTIFSHDTLATGVELDALVDDSIVDDLHRHSQLVASDGTPDPVLSVDVDGNVGIGTASPNSTLHVNDSNTGVTVTPTTNADNPVLTMQNNADTDRYILKYDGPNVTVKLIRNNGSLAWAADASGNVNLGNGLTVVGSVVNMDNLPTAAGGLASGDLWNNSGVLNIV